MGEHRSLTVGWLISRTSSEMPLASRGLVQIVRGNLGLIAIVLVLARAFLDGLGYQHPDDPLLLSNAGLRLLEGDLHEVYLDERVQVGPLGLVIYGFAGLMEQGGLPLIASLTLVAGSVFAGALWLCVAALSACRSSGRKRASLAVAVAVVAGLSWTASTSGHPTEGLVALLWVYAAYCAQNDRFLNCGAALGLAISIKLFAVLGLPLLLLLSGAKRRAHGLAAAGVVAIVFWGPALLTGAANMLEFTWEIRPQSPLTLFFQPGTDFGWPLRVFQAAVVGGAGSAIAIALRSQNDAFLRVPLILMALRFATDPLDYHYYLLGPGTVALVAWALRLSKAKPLWWLALPTLYYGAIVPFFVLNGALLRLWILALAMVLIVIALLVRTRAKSPVPVITV